MVEKWPQGGRRQEEDGSRPSKGVSPSYLLVFPPEKDGGARLPVLPPSYSSSPRSKKLLPPPPPRERKRKRNRWFQRWRYPCSIAFYTAGFSKTIMRRYVIFLEKVDCFTNTQKSLAISGFFLGRFIFSFSGNVGGAVGGKGRDRESIVAPGKK